MTHPRASRALLRFLTNHIKCWCREGCAQRAVFRPLLDFKIICQPGNAAKDCSHHLRLFVGVVCGVFDTGSWRSCSMQPRDAPRHGFPLPRRIWTGCAWTGKVRPLSMRAMVDCVVCIFSASCSCVSPAAPVPAISSRAMANSGACASSQPELRVQPAGASSVSPGQSSFNSPLIPRYKPSR